MCFSLCLCRSGRVASPGSWMERCHHLVYRLHPESDCRWSSCCTSLTLTISSCCYSSSVTGTSSSLKWWYIVYIIKRETCFLIECSLSHSLSLSLCVSVSVSVSVSLCQWHFDSLVMHVPITCIVGWFFFLIKICLRFEKKMLNVLSNNFF